MPIVHSNIWFTCIIVWLSRFLWETWIQFWYEYVTTDHCGRIINFAWLNMLIWASEITFFKWKEKNQMLYKWNIIKTYKIRGQKSLPHVVQFMFDMYCNVDLIHTKTSMKYPFKLIVFGEWQNHPLHFHNKLKR